MVLYILFCWSSQAETSYLTQEETANRFSYRLTSLQSMAYIYVNLGSENIVLEADVQLSRFVLPRFRNTLDSEDEIKFQLSKGARGEGFFLTDWIADAREFEQNDKPNFSSENLYRT